MTTRKTIALIIQTFVDKVMSLLFNTLSSLVIAFLPRSKRLNFMAAVTICSDRSNPFMGFPNGSAVKNPPANAGDVGLISGLGRSPGGEHGNPL